MNVAFFRRTSVYNLLLLTIGTLLGLLAYDVHNPQRLNLHYTNQITLDETYTVVARIEQQPQRTPKRLKSVVEMNEVRVGDTCIPVCGKTIIYFDTIYNTLNVGDEVVFSGRLTQVAEDIGIEGLNWRKVMKQRKIYAQCFVDDLALLKKGGGKVKYVDRLRSWVAQRIEAA